MQCPKCGATIPAGSLYCEQCGEDIHIVPDFEPEIERNIEQAINGIVEEIGLHQTNENIKNKSDRPSLKYFTGLFSAGGIVVLVLMTITGVLLYTNHSYSYQKSRAERYLLSGKYKEACEAYSNALTLATPKEAIDIKIALADVYFQENNKIEYEYLLREIVKDTAATAEQIDSAYGKLIAIYKAREDYTSINELLLASNNQDIIRNYQSYVALPPEFSIQSGYYSEVLPLKLSAFGNGTIYYTLDGSVPNEDSAIYTAPIILDDGDYIVSAYFVNENGIASEMIQENFHVQIDILPSPDVTTVSGDYEFPISIEVDLENEEGDVYYTTDGSDPGLSSNLYVGPIHMPLGKSTFKFIRSDGTRNSEIVERTYDLKLNSDYTTEQATKDVIAYSLQCGKINDESGHFNDTSARYAYQYQYVTNILKVSDFYVIAEILCDEEGNPSKTGNLFAVNVYDGKIFRLLVDGRNNYTLVDIE